MDWRRSLERICADRKSGSFVLTKKTARLLAQMARSGVKPTKLIEAAEKVANAHPAMAPLWHLAQLTKEVYEHRQNLISGLDNFLAELEAHTQAAIAHAKEWIPEGRVITHSFSSLVFRTLVQAFREGKKIEVVCTVSLPGGEGSLWLNRLRKQICQLCSFPTFKPLDGYCNANSSSSALTLGAKMGWCTRSEQGI
mgnify:CR=1 FL=1